MIKIYGLTKEQCALLKKVAIQKVDKQSISLLAKQLLLNEIEISTTTEKPKTERKRRAEIRLNPSTQEKLLELATAQGMTLNRFMVMLLNNYIEDTKIMSATQIQALRESNYQLYQIGTNINQIAKALNQGKSASLTSQKLDELAKLIDEHTSKVADVISTTPTL